MVQIGCRLPVRLKKRASLFENYSENHQTLHRENMLTSDSKKFKHAVLTVDLPLYFELRVVSSTNV